MFNQAKILVFGDLILDEWLYGDASRLSPEAPVPVIKADHYKYSLGGAGNVAANVASLGGIPILVSLVDSGPIQHTLRENGVGAYYCVLDPWRKVPHKVRVIANKQQVCRIDREDVRPISPGLEEELVGKILTAICKEEPSAIIISDYNKGLVTQTMLLAIIEAAHGGRNIPVLLDPKPANVKAYSSHIDIMTPNLHEAERLAGVQITDDRTLEDAGRTLMLRYGCKNVIITQGENGMTGFWSEGPHSADIKSHHVPAQTRQVFDVAGAGDTVIAAVALGIASKMPFKDIVLVANGYASIAVSKPGTVAVKADDFPFILDRKEGQ